MVLGHELGLFITGLVFFLCKPCLLRFLSFSTGLAPHLLHIPLIAQCPQPCIPMHFQREHPVTNIWAIGGAPHCS